MGHFVQNGLQHIANKSTQRVVEKGHLMNNKLLCPEEGPTIGSMFMKAISWKEQWAATYQHTHIHRLNYEEKSLLMHEPALFKGFFDNDPMDVDSIHIVTFIKTANGMKTAMDQRKEKKLS